MTEFTRVLFSDFPHHTGKQIQTTPHMHYGLTSSRTLKYAASDWLGSEALLGFREPIIGYVPNGANKT